MIQILALKKITLVPSYIYLTIIITAFFMLFCINYLGNCFKVKNLSNRLWLGLLLLKMLDNIFLAFNSIKIILLLIKEMNCFATTIETTNPTFI